MYNPSNRAYAISIMIHNIKFLANQKGDREYDKMRVALTKTFISSFSKNAINN
jgi:hypothetical protein